jgi:hypothetical protein
MFTPGAQKALNRSSLSMHLNEGESGEPAFAVPLSRAVDKSASFFQSLLKK